MCNEEFEVSAARAATKLKWNHPTEITNECALIVMMLIVLPPAESRRSLWLSPCSRRPPSLLGIAACNRNLCLGDAEVMMSAIFFFLFIFSGRTNGENSSETKHECHHQIFIARMGVRERQRERETGMDKYDMSAYSIRFIACVMCEIEREKKTIRRKKKKRKQRPKYREEDELT